MNTLSVFRSVSCGTAHTHVWLGSRRIAWGLGPNPAAADGAAWVLALSLLGTETLFAV